MRKYCVWLSLLAAFGAVTFLIFLIAQPHPRGLTLWQQYEEWRSCLRFILS